MYRFKTELFLCSAVFFADKIIDTVPTEAFLLLGNIFGFSTQHVLAFKCSYASHARINVIRFGVSGLS